MSSKIMVLCLALMMSGLLLWSTGNGIGDQEDYVFADSNVLKIGPMTDDTEAKEDEKYNSKYFASMGEMHFNSLTTSADWLTWEYSDPLVIDTTNNEGYWSFDQRDARDDSGNRHDGTIVGAVATQGVFGRASAMAFDGDDYISIPHDASFNITSAITLEAWIYPTFTDSGEHMIISKGGPWSDDDPQNYELTMDRDRPLFQIKLPGGEDWYGAAPNDPITKNTWHHVAGVYENSRFLIYVDGVNQTNLLTGWGGTYKGTVYAGGLPTSSHDISIGRRQPASWGSLYFEGSIDEARIWDRALSADEILTHTAIPGQRCLNLTGTPDNTDVGSVDVTLNITDNLGAFAERTFALNVENTPPEITTEDILNVYQDEEYINSYDADDEGQGLTGWTLQTNHGWLSIDQMSGTISGTPTNDDVGIHWVNITFNDGNGGKDWSVFDLEVLDINDVPTITTMNVDTAMQGSLYSVDYEGVDIDGEELEWDIVTDASWLTIDNITGILSGTPSNDDIGIFNVNVTATDPRGLFAFTEFDLEVIDVNDEPTWVDVPSNTTINEGDMFVFDLNAADLDILDNLVYSIESFPVSNISVNDTTGMIEWTATREPFETEPYILTVRASASDGLLTITHTFNLEMIVNPSANTTLSLPQNESTIPSNHTTLQWHGIDPGMDELIYEVYLSTIKSDVTMFKEEAMIVAAFDMEELFISDLEPGQTYYWTVIAYDGFSFGICLNETSSFYVNLPPTSQLKTPVDDAKVSTTNLEITWIGIDSDGVDITYDLYLGKDEASIVSLDPNALLMEDLDIDSYTLASLDEGDIYYWTVVPDDGFSTGICTNGVFSFQVNNIPTIDPKTISPVKPVSSITVDINGSDGDLDTLVFSLEDPPVGMTIDPSTGLITWSPSIDQVGIHTIKVILTDGIETTNQTFNIEVLELDDATSEPEENNGAVVVIIIIVIVLVILAILIAVILLMKKGPKKDEDEIEGEIPPEEETLPSQINAGSMEEQTPGVPIQEPQMAPTAETTPPEPIAPETEPIPPEPVQQPLEPTIEPQAPVTPEPVPDQQPLEPTIEPETPVVQEPVPVDTQIDTNIEANQEPMTQQSSVEP